QLGDNTGTLAFNGGTLRSLANINPGVQRPITVSASGGTFDTAGAKLSITGAITGTGTLTKIATGTLSVEGTSGGYSGEWHINEGFLHLNNNNSLGDDSATNRLVLGTATLGATVRVYNDMEMQRPVVLNVGGS